MNQVITIPKKIAQRGDLIVMSRAEYEAMRRSLKELSGVIPENTLDADLAKSLAEYRAGKYVGPFDTAKDGVAFLKSHKKQAQKR